jgi:ubiquinone/menaquinone biosynthesis C-methylase UbiE
MNDVLRWRKRLVSEIDGVVLEIGVGSGANLPYYRRAAAVFAIEPNQSSAQRAHSTALRCAIPMSVKIGVAEELPFADASIDHVVSSLVFCSVGDQYRALREIRRVLRPSGVLHMVEHIRPQEPLLAAAASAITPYWSRIAHNCHLDRPTLEVLRNEGWHVRVLQRLGVFVRIEARM